MRRALAAVLLVGISCVSASAWRWPTEDSAVQVAFGQTREGTYSRGILIRTTADTVYPVADGVVSFVSGDTPAGTELGVTVVVDHPRGFRSFYGHLRPGSTPNPGTVVTEETPIGTPGDSGSADGTSLYLSVLDTRTGVFVNPLLLLPAFEDDVAPTVTSVLAQTSNSLFDLRLSSAVPAGRYTLLLECSDRWVPGGSPVAPYEVTVLVGGQQMFSATHERIGFGTGFPAMQPGPPREHAEARTPDGGYVAGTVAIPEGRIVIEVFVSDFAGNEASAVLEVTGIP